MVEKIEVRREIKEWKKKQLKAELVDRMEKLKEEIKDMETIVKEEILTEDVSDIEMASLMERVKELEKQIVKIIE